MYSILCFISFPVLYAHRLYMCMYSYKYNIDTPATLFYLSGCTAAAHVLLWFNAGYETNKCPIGFKGDLVSVNILVWRLAFNAFNIMALENGH